MCRKPKAPYWGTGSLQSMAGVLAASHKEPRLSGRNEARLTNPLIPLSPARRVTVTANSVAYAGSWVRGDIHESGP